MYRLLHAVLLCVAGFVAAPSQAATIYKCTDAQDRVTYQSSPCAANSRGGEVTLRADPAAAKPPLPARRLPAASSPSTMPSTAATAPKTPAVPRDAQPAPEAPQSWECTAYNKEVFYQHTPCPESIAGNIDVPRSRTGGYSREWWPGIPVKSKPVSREYACQRIREPSASARFGHERDEDVGTYERNLGRGLCR